MCVKKKIPVDNFDICLSVKKKKKRNKNRDSHISSEIEYTYISLFHCFIYISVR